MVFMIQNSGDYTSRLLKYMYIIKKNIINKAAGETVGTKYKLSLREYLISMKIWIISLYLVENNKNYFLKFT